MDYDQIDNRMNFLNTSPVPVAAKMEKCCLGIDEAGRGPVLGEFSNSRFSQHYILQFREETWLGASGWKHVFDFFQ